MLALEPRFKVGVLLAGGFASARTLPEVDALHFVPRVTTPLLLIDGESDFVFQVDKGQKPYIAALGRPKEHKRYLMLPGGHDIMAQRRSQVVKEILDWLDRYLGPVQR